MQNDGLLGYCLSFWAIILHTFGVEVWLFLYSGVPFSAWPFTKTPTIWRSVLGPMIFWKLPYEGLIAVEVTACWRMLLT